MLRRGQRRPLARLAAALGLATLLVGLDRAPLAAAPPGLEKGGFLVAGRDLVDPNFAQAVVLLVDYGPQGAMGLVLNRPTATDLEGAIPGLPQIEAPVPPIYEGGPVARRVMIVLVRSEEAIEGAERVLDTVWVSGRRALLEELLVVPEAERPTFRVYSGYAGWAPGQLDREIERGGWHLVPGSAERVFDPAPESLWRRMLDAGAARWAALGR